MPVKWKGIRKKPGPVKACGRVQKIAERRKKQREVMKQIRAVQEDAQQ
jgi:hypothetical protein